MLETIFPFLSWVNLDPFKYDQRQRDVTDILLLYINKTFYLLLKPSIHFPKHFLLSCKLSRLQGLYNARDGVVTLVAGILTWGSISGQRWSWPSPTPGAGAHHQESRKKTDANVEGRDLLGACRTGSHQKRPPTAGRPGMSVHGHGGVWVLRRSQHQCWPVLGLEEKKNSK